MEDWAGKAISLYIAQVSAFGETVDAIRVRSVAPRIEKPKLAADRFEKMLTQIKAGKFSAEQAKERFALTSDQIKQINDVQI